jgi:hypothetical protein
MAIKHYPDTRVEVCGTHSAAQYRLPPGRLTVAVAEQCAYQAAVIEGFHGPVFGPGTS